MTRVTIYTASLCPFCHLAKDLLADKGLAIDEIDVTGKPALRAQMVERAGGRCTVPQIWIGQRHIGGCNDLMCLERSGKLDALLKA